MSEHDDRPQDGPGPHDQTGAAPRPEDEPSGSVLSGYSWDDPADPEHAGPAAPDPGPSDGAPRTGSSAAGATPAAYPPPAPYPPAGSTGEAPPDPYGTSAAGGWSSTPADQPTTGASSAGGYGQGSGAPAAPYGQDWSRPVPPEQGYGSPYGQQQPYGQGYGQSASYTTTPQPYAYGPPPLSPEAEKVRSSAVLWTVLNGVAIFLCGNVFAIPGVILAALAIGKSRDDLPGARGFVKWSWILFAIGFALALLAVIAYVVFIVVVGTASMSGGF